MNSSTIIDRMQESLRVNKYSQNVGKAYMYWAQAFLAFHKNREPSELGLVDVKAFLDHLKQERFAITRTLDQAVHAIRFLYSDVLEVNAPWLDRYIKERDGPRARNVLTPRQAQRLLSHLFGQDWLAASLLYGAGLRISECVRLRIRDLNFQNNTVLVRKPDGEVQRVTVMPKKLVGALRSHLEDRKMVHIKDIADGFGEVHLPASIARDYPEAGRSWGWQYVFSSSQRAAEPRAGGRVRRSHAEENLIRRAIERAALEADVYQQTSADTLRNSFAVHLIQQGVDVKSVEALLGHGGEEDQAPYLTTKSPLDRLLIH